MDAASYSVWEGDTVAVVLTRHGDLSRESTLNYSLTNGSGVVAGDYLDSPGGSMSFGVDVSEAVITISALADLVFDEAAEETVTVTLTPMALDANVQLTADVASAVLIGDVPVVGMVAEVYNIFEGDAAFVALERHGDLSRESTVDFSLADGLGWVTSDYIVSPAGSITFAVDETRVVINVTALADRNFNEPADEAVRFTLAANQADSQPANVQVSADVSSSVVIGDVPVISVGAAAYIGQEGSTAFVEVNRDGDLSRTSQVTFGVAGNASDFAVMPARVLLFDVDVAQLTVPINLTLDGLHEAGPSDVLQFTITEPLNAQLTLAASEVTIEDVTPTISMGSATYSSREGDQVLVVVNRAGDLTLPSRVTFDVLGAEHDGVADDGNVDFVVLTEMVLVFAPGVDTLTVPINITADGLREECPEREETACPEVLDFILANPTNAKLFVNSTDRSQIVVSDVDPLEQFPHQVTLGTTLATALSPHDFVAAAASNAGGAKVVITDYTLETKGAFDLQDASFDEETAAGRVQKAQVQVALAKMAGTTADAVTIDDAASARRRAQTTYTVTYTVTTKADVSAMFGAAGFTSGLKSAIEAAAGDADALVAAGVTVGEAAAGHAIVAVQGFSTAPPAFVTTIEFTLTSTAPIAAETLSAQLDPQTLVLALGAQGVVISLDDVVIERTNVPAAAVEVELVEDHTIGIVIGITLGILLGVAAGLVFIIFIKRMDRGGVNDLSGGKAGMDDPYNTTIDIEARRGGKLLLGSGVEFDALVGRLARPAADGGQAGTPSDTEAFQQAQVAALADYVTHYESTVHNDLWVSQAVAAADPKHVMTAREREAFKTLEGGLAKIAVTSDMSELSNMVRGETLGPLPAVRAMLDQYTRSLLAVGVSKTKLDLHGGDQAKLMRAKATAADKLVSIHRATIAHHDEVGFTLPQFGGGLKLTRLAPSPKAASHGPNHDASALAISLPGQTPAPADGDAVHNPSPAGAARQLNLRAP